MVIVTLAPGGAYQQLYPLAGYTAPASLIVMNNTPATLFVTQSGTMPANDAQSYPVPSGETILVHGNMEPIWVRGQPGPIVVQLLSRTVTPFTAIELPHDVMTATTEGYRRVRVDPGQTSFFQGREFRTFKEFSIAAGTSYFIKAIVPVDTILWNLRLVVDAGGLRMNTLANVGVTETVPFSEQLPRLGKNLMSNRQAPYYTVQNNVLGGGQITGGLVIDTVRVVAPSATSQQTYIAGSTGEERGVAPGTYYWRLENLSNGTVTGTCHAWWW